jgi:hypothetical protein
MVSEQWSRIVTASIAPVVVISACGLMSLAFYNRLASIVSRLRGFQRERLHEQEEIHRLARLTPPDEAGLGWRRRFLENLAHQTARTMRRARMVRFTLLCLLGTVALLVLSSLLNGLTVVWSDAQFGAALLYLAGMVLLLTGIVSAIAELLSALDVVEAETRLVAELAEAADDVFAAPDGSDPPASATREAP